MPALLNPPVRPLTFVLTPVNDEPCNAIEVTPTAPGVSVCTNPVNGDVQVASFNNLVTCTSNNPDVWYKFTASTSHVISITGNNLFEPAFAVFAASNCADVALPAIFCAEGPASANGTTYGGLTGLTVGATYYIKVSNASSNSSASTTFSICVLTPVNDEACTAAICYQDWWVKTLAVILTGNMLLATSSGIVFGCNGTGASGIPDLWYKFVATNSGHLIRVEGLSGIRLISLYSSNDCNNPGGKIQCNCCRQYCVLNNLQQLCRVILSSNQSISIWHCSRFQYLPVNAPFLIMNPVVPLTSSALLPVQQHAVTRRSF
jgi:hypothetical protein